MNPFQALIDSFDLLIKERGSSSILRERLHLAADQFALSERQKLALADKALILEKEIVLLKDENAMLKKEKEALIKENERLKLDNSELRAQIKVYENRNTGFSSGVVIT